MKSWTCVSKFLKILKTQSLYIILLTRNGKKSGLVVLMRGFLECNNCIHSINGGNGRSSNIKIDPPFVIDLIKIRKKDQPN